MQESDIDIQDILSNLANPEKCPTKLLLHNVNISDDISKICDFLKINEILLHLDLKNNNIDNKGAMEIGNAIKSNTHLKYLDVSYNYFTYEGAKEIFKGLKVNRSLNYVDISNNQMTCYDDIQREIYVAFQFNKTLQYLNLSKNNITDKTAKTIFEGLAINISLKELNLSYNNITGSFHEILSNCLEKNKTLNVLNLGHNPISNQFLISLAEAFPKSSIKSINLSSLLHTSAEGLDQFIKSLYNNTILTDLDISINLLSSDIAELLTRNKTLRKLNISSTNIQDEEVIRIFEVLEKDSDLTHLNISSILTSESIIPTISQCLKNNNKLEYLNMSYIKVGNNAQILADGIRKAKGLKILDLSGIKELNKIGKKQIIHSIAANPPIIKYIMDGLDFEPDHYTEITKALKANTRLEDLSLRSIDPDIKIEQNVLDSFVSIYQTSKSLKNLITGIEDIEQQLLCKNFENSNLTSVPEMLFKMTHLQVLNLSNNQLTYLPEHISLLKELRELDVSSNQLNSLPTSLVELTNLKTLKLLNNPFKTPPPEILKSNNIKNIIGYLKDLKSGSIPVYKMKVMMVGQENVGKTTVLKLLKRMGSQRKTFNLKKTASKQTISTDGIDIDEWQIDISFDDDSNSNQSNISSDGSNKEISSSRNTISKHVSYLNIYKLYDDSSSSKKTVSISAWDFAGQEIYYTTHQFFLSTRSVYIVVWDLRYDPDECKVSYWFQSIRSRTKNSPVLIVGTHSDELPSQEEADSKAEQVRRKFKKKFPFIKASIAVSCKSEYNINVLFNHLKNIIREQHHMGERIPKSYIEFDRVIREELSNIQKGMAKYPPIRTLDEIRDLGTHCNIKDDEHFKRCIKFLHDTGTLIYFDDPSMNLKDLVIIDPQFLTKVMATIITTKNNIKDGIIHKHMFPIIWRPPAFPQEIHDTLLRLLEIFEIVYSLPKSVRDKIGYKRARVPLIGQKNQNDVVAEMIEQDDDIDILVPSILPEEKPEFDLVWIENDLSKIQYDRYYRFEFVPKGFFSRLMIRCLHIVDTVNEYWRNGIIATRDKDMLFLEIIPNESLLKLSVRGPRISPPTDTLRICADMIDVLIGMNSWFKVNVDISVPCSHCKESGIEPSKVTHFSLEQIESCLSKGEFLIKCNSTDETKNVLIGRLIPDLILIDLERSKISPSEITYGEEIGKGSFGIIHKGVYKGIDIAIKTMKTSDDINQKMLQDFRKEAWIMSGMKHPNLVKMLGFCLEPFSIIMEYIPYGNLYRYLKSMPKNEYNWPFIIKVALDIARGMNYLHDSSPSFIHRDLKSPNILMIDVNPNAPICAKIGDFGLSSRMYVPSLKEYTSTRNVGNPIWLAPEIIKEEEFTEKSDIYSYGIILWELCSKEHPFSEYKYEFMFELENMIKNGVRPTIPNDVPESFSQLIRSCWDGDPIKRPPFSEIIKILKSIASELAPSLEILDDHQIIDSMNESDDDNSNNNMVMESPRALDIENNIFCCSSGQLLKKINTNKLIYSICKVDEFVWAGTGDGSILVFNRKNGQQITSHQNIHKSPISFIYNFNGSVFTASWNEKLCIWNHMIPDITTERAIIENEVPLKEGIVYRKSGLISKMKKIHLSLRNKTLFLTKIGSNKVIGSFELSKVQIIPENNPKKSGFHINGNQKSISIFCKDKDDQNSWMNVIDEEMKDLDELHRIELVKEIQIDGVLCMTIIGDQIWGGTKDMRIKIWDSSSYELIKVFKVDLMISLEDNIDLPITSIHYFNDMIWIGVKNYLVILDKISFLPINCLNGHTYSIIKILGYESKIFTISEDQSLKVWDIHSLKCLETYTEVCEKPYSMIIKGNSLWVSGKDGSIWIINCNDLSIEKQLENHHENAVHDLCVSDGTVWAGGFDSVISIWK